MRFSSKIGVFGEEELLVSGTGPEWNKFLHMVVTVHNVSNEQGYSDEEKIKLAIAGLKHYFPWGKEIDLKLENEDR